MLSQSSPGVLRRLAIVVLYGLIAAVFCRRLFDQPHALGISDWDQHLFYYASVIKSALEYGEFPFWNPWYCGGNVLWQNPQVALVSPAYALTGVTSLALAVKLNIVLHYWIGLVGMHVLLVRVVGLRFLPAVLLLALTYVASGSPALHLAVGHSVFLPVFYLPWLACCGVRAVRHGGRRDAIFGGAVVACMVYSGGLHIVPMAIVAMGTFAAASGVLRRSWRPIAAMALLFAIGFAFAAPRLVPAVLFVTSDRFLDARVDTGHPDFVTLEMLRRAYTDADQTLSIMYETQRHGWWEFGNYVGAIPIALFCGSLIWVVFSRSRSERTTGAAFAVTALFLLLLSAGEFADYAPAWLVNSLPGFSRFRVPSRYTIPFVLMATLTVAWALRGVTVAALAVRLVFAALSLLAAVDLVDRNSRPLEYVFTQPPLDRAFRPGGGSSIIRIEPHASAFAPGSPMLRALMADRNFYECYEPLQLIRTADRERPAAFTDSGATVVQTAVSPNRIDVDVVGHSTPFRLLLNQNHAPGWQSTAGEVTLQPAGHGHKPGVQLPAGFGGRVTFWYRPPGLWAGIAILIAATGASIFAVRANPLPRR